MVSGLVNGVAAIGGIAVAVMLSAVPMAPAVLRATLIWLFLFTDLYALAWAALLPATTSGDLLGTGTWQLVLWLAPAMLVGIWVGQRGFAGVSPQRFRRWVLNLIAGIAAIAMLRALVELLR